MSMRLTQITITHNYRHCNLNLLIPLSQQDFINTERLMDNNHMCMCTFLCTYTRTHAHTHTHTHTQTYIHISGEQVSFSAGNWDVNLTFQSTEEERFVSCQRADDTSSWQWFKMHQTGPKTFSVFSYVWTLFSSFVLLFYFLPSL